MAVSATATTGFQFRLRTIAAAVTVLAVMFAALAPWLREYDAGQWWRFAQVWLCGAVGFTLVVASCSLMRLRAARRGGRRHGSVCVDGYPGSMTAFVLLSLINVAILLWLSMQVAHVPSNNAPLWPRHFLAGMTGFGAGLMWSLFLVRTGQLQLCDHGLVAGVGLIPWKSVQSWRWAGTGASRVLVLRVQMSTARFFPTPDDEHGIEALLTSRVGKPA